MSQIPSPPVWQITARTIEEFEIKAWADDANTCNKMLFHILKYFWADDVRVDFLPNGMYRENPGLPSLNSIHYEADPVTGIMVKWMAANCEAYRFIPTNESQTYQLAGVIAELIDGGITSIRATNFHGNSYENIKYHREP